MGNLEKWLKKEKILPEKNAEKIKNSDEKKIKKTENSNEKKFSEKKNNSNFREKNGKNFPRKNDPNFGRPTFLKREKFHPTNFLPKKNAGEIKIVPLGGVEQIGSNLMFLEWGDDIVLIDCGFSFPSPDHLGVDFLIPNISYLKKNLKKIRGVIFTHGHLDHIGGVPFILPELNFPQIFATRLTKELILAHSEEYKISQKLKIYEINPQSKIKLGKFEFEFFHINHSIPDGVGIVAKTPYGKIVHSGDFKFDFNPSDDQPIDLGRIAEIGKSGVALAMIDSTNSAEPGFTISENKIEISLEKIVRKTDGRLIVAMFASNIGRFSKLIEIAEKYGRTVFISGRSMERNIEIAKKLNYLKCQKNTVQKMSTRAEKIDPKKVLILSTGSQGEELAALTRMAAGTHRDIKLRSTDTVIFSSSTIPGNEIAIVSVLNNLASRGVKTIRKKKLDIHTSGHANAEECKLMNALLNPKFFAPIHGEIYHRVAHAEMISRDLEFSPKNIFLMKNGRGIILSSRGARLFEKKEEISAGEILIEVGEKIGENILSDRRKISESGIIFLGIGIEKNKIKNFEIRARGFLFMNQNHEIFNLIEKKIREIFAENVAKNPEKKHLEKLFRAITEKIFFRKFKKNPAVEIISKFKILNSNFDPKKIFELKNKIGDLRHILNVRGKKIENILSFEKLEKFLKIEKIVFKKK